MEKHSESKSTQCCHKADKATATPAGASAEEAGRGAHAGPMNAPVAVSHDDHCCHGSGTQKNQPVAKDSVSETAPVASGGHCCHGSDQAPSTLAVEYSCPMHPEIVRSAPGDCPICGMALERTLPAGIGQWVCPMCPGVASPVATSCPKCGMALEPAMPLIQSDESEELRDMRRRFRISLLFTVPLVLLAMAGMAQGVSTRLPGRAMAWIQLLLAAPVVLWCGQPLLARAWQSLRTRNLNMFTLIGLGVVLAFGFSVVATLVPGVIPEAFSHGEGVGLYFESAAAIITLVLLGQVLELRARHETGSALRALLDLAPKTARRLDEHGDERDVPLQNVGKGDRLRVRPGEKIPVDGVIIEGQAVIDESMVTGESMPVSRASGEAVIGGTQNGERSFVMQAQRVGSETLLAQIVLSVAQAQRSRAPVQALADRVSAWFVPAVVLIALVAAVTWALVGPEPRLAYAVVIAVSTLIIACPCALGLATPMSMTVAMGRGAQAGVLFSNAQALESLRDVDTLVLDKTGTLTEGRPEVLGLRPVGAATETELLRFAASLEQASEHPLAAAIVRAALARDIRLGRNSAFEALPGRGATGIVQTRPVVVGNAGLMTEQGIDVAALGADAAEFRDDAQTVVYVAVDKQLLGLIGIADPLKETSRQAVQSLQAAGLRLVMLTGDHETTARAVARELGIEEVEAGVLPDQKAAVIRRLQEAGRKVAMAGDGINDAPALATADVGIAMGTGTDVAKQSADVTLVTGDLRAIGRAVKLSEATMKNIRQNLAFAFGYNSLGVPIAAGALYPALGLLLSPAFAAAAMSLSSVSVITNALRLRRVRIDETPRHIPDN